MIQLVTKINGQETTLYYQTYHSAGFDFVAAEAAVIAPGDYRAISTGSYLVEIDGDEVAPFEIQVRPRSGLAYKHGVTVLNAPGTIDCDYRQEIKVILINHGSVPFVINVGDRIAQGVIAPVYHNENIASVKQTQRSGGCGSTGQ